jgi:hypothetical protein
MNQVTQSNAANSEESASAAEELTSQAAELANMVSAFKVSVRSAINQSSRRGLPPPPAPVKRLAALPAKTGNKPNALVTVKKPAKAVKADEFISLNDDELSVF